MIARLLHYYIITRLNPVFIKILKSDGRKRKRARGYVWFYGFVGYCFEKSFMSFLTTFPARL